jgi:hypothetical protein
MEDPLYIYSSSFQTGGPLFTRLNRILFLMKGVSGLFPDRDHNWMVRSSTAHLPAASGFRF